MSLNREPFTDPDALLPEHVDPGIWPLVERINRSGWLWTMESCEGHDGRHPPMLGFATNHPARALMALNDAMDEVNPQAGRLDPDYTVHLGVYANSRSSLGAHQFRVTADRVVLDRFAALVTT